jgi:antirestriction protein ArdC
MDINRNRTPAVRFATLAHELEHLLLGHLGKDRALHVPERPKRLETNHTQRELEAESGAYLICARNGVTSKSETSLANYVTQNTLIDEIDLYQVMRAAGQVESLFGLTEKVVYEHMRPYRVTKEEGSMTPRHRLLIMLILVLTVSRAQAATFTVDPTGDDTPRSHSL